MREGSYEATSGRTSAEGNTGRNDGKTFFAAVVLARRGRYVEATKLLQKALSSGECSEADALDLQGRMYAQQGLHLHAESCWHRAKDLDEANPAYDRALSRLRRDRSVSSRILQAAGAISFIFTLGLLLWQVALVNPYLANQLKANDKLLTAVREDVSRFEDDSLARSKASAESIGGLRNNLNYLESSVSKRLRALPTTTETSNDRDRVIAYLDQQSSRLEKSFRQEVEGLTIRRTKAEVAQIKQIETIEQSVAAIGKSVTAMKTELGERVEVVNTGLRKRLDTIETSIKGDIGHWPTTDELVKLNHTIAQLQIQMSEIAAGMGQHQDHSYRNNAGSGDVRFKSDTISTTTGQ